MSARYFGDAIACAKSFSTHNSNMRPAAFSEIKLIWRPKPSTPRRVVGTLSMVKGEPCFVYDGPDLALARTEGFKGYPGMERLEAEYNGQAMRSFASRLPSRERPRLDALYGAWGATVTMDDFQVLGLTFGRLPTDCFEFIAVIPPIPETSFYTDVAGLAHHGHAEDMLQVPPGATLDLEREAENLYDSHAVRVSYGGHQIGFIKKVHCESVAAALSSGVNVRAELVRVRMNPVIQEVILNVQYLAPVPVIAAREG